MTAPRAQKPWNSSMQLRHDATDDELRRRFQVVPGTSYEQAAIAIAREFAAACVEEARRTPSADTRRLDKLFALLPFDVRHQFGGDIQEFREGIDAAMTPEGE